MATGGETIRKVEVSSDDGNTWQEASLTEQDNRWTWVFWAHTVKLPRGRHTLVARATDSAGLRQPESVAPLWNFKGYMNNAWHRVTVEAV
jgi:sulfite oxidase